ncbi:MAG: hypothetical protein AB7U49_15985 [Hyphomicrobiaceae bacterium]
MFGSCAVIAAHEAGKGGNGHVGRAREPDEPEAVRGTTVATAFDYIDEGNESLKALSLILAAWDEGAIAESW